MERSANVKGYEVESKEKKVAVREEWKNMHME